MAEVFLGLGSNIRRYHHISAALDALGRCHSSLRISSVYETEAVGFAGDPFLNLVVGLECQLGLAEFVVSVRQLEIELGRDAQATKFSARTMDIDILSFDQLTGTFLSDATFPASLGLKGLELPREEILYNAFVLRPLAELAPDHCHPVSGRRYADLWTSFQGRREGLRKVDFRWGGRLISQA